MTRYIPGDRVRLLKPLTEIAEDNITVEYLAKAGYLGTVEAEGVASSDVAAYVTFDNGLLWMPLFDDQIEKVTE